MCSNDHFLASHPQTNNGFFFLLLSPIAQSIVSQTADPGVASSIPAWSHTFLEIDHEVISMVSSFR